jgi:hypothetical protein
MQRLVASPLQLLQSPAPCLGLLHIALHDCKPAPLHVSTWLRVHLSFTAVGRSVIGLIGPLSTMASRCSAQPAPAESNAIDANTNRQKYRIGPSCSACG